MLLLEEDVPSWKGRRGRLAAAREWRRTMLEAIAVERARFWLVVWLRFEVVELVVVVGV
jgi:hypothetical protein